jgi:hypothetical protein
LEVQFIPYNIGRYNLNYIIMSFNGNEGEQITLSEGGAYTLRYRSENPNAVKGVFFGRDHIEQILAQSDCKGLRMYFAKNADGSPTLVVVGADSNENDQLNLIFQRLLPCPDRCSTANALNIDPKLNR